MTTSLNCCPSCGSALSGRDVCTCGFVAAERRDPPPGETGSAAAGSSAPVGVWLQQLGTRLLQLVQWQQPVQPLALPAGVIGIAARALIVAAIADRAVDNLLQSALAAARAPLLMGEFLFGAWLGDSTPARNPDLPVFSWVLLAALCASAAAVGVIVLKGDWTRWRERLPAAAAVVVDAQWAVLTGLLAAWLLAGLSRGLAVAALAAAVAWGQGLFWHGLESFGWSHRDRTWVQVLSAAAGTLVLGLVAARGFRSILSGLF